MGKLRVLSELARVKALFQQRAIFAHMGVDPDSVPAAAREDAGDRSPFPASGVDVSKRFHSATISEKDQHDHG